MPLAPRRSEVSRKRTAVTTVHSTGAHSQEREQTGSSRAAALRAPGRLPGGNDSGNRKVGGTKGQSPGPNTRTRVPEAAGSGQEGRRTGQRATRGMKLTQEETKGVTEVRPDRICRWSELLREEEGGQEVKGGRGGCRPFIWPAPPPPHLIRPRGLSLAPAYGLACKHQPQARAPRLTDGGFPDCLGMSPLSLSHWWVFQSELPSPLPSSAAKR